MHDTIARVICRLKASEIQGALVFNVIRKIAMALFKQDTTKSASMAKKKKMECLYDDYSLTLLESGIKRR